MQASRQRKPKKVGGTHTGYMPTYGICTQAHKHRPSRRKVRQTSIARTTEMLQYHNKALRKHLLGAIPGKKKKKEKREATNLWYYVVSNNIYGLVLLCVCENFVMCQRSLRVVTVRRLLKRRPQQEGVLLPSEEMLYTKPGFCWYCYPAIIRKQFLISNFQRLVRALSKKNAIGKN